MRISPKTLGALSIIAIVSPAALAADAGPMQAALSSAAEARGDYDGLSKVLVAIIAKDPNSRAARVALARLEAIRAEVSDPQATIRKPLSAIALKSGADLENADRIRSLLADLAEEAGDFEEAERIAAARGFVRDWLVIGPFGFTTKALHDRPFAVEAALRASAVDASERLPGNAGPVAWREVKLPALSAGLDASEHIYPHRGAAYALAQVEAAPGTKAIVRVRSSGSYRVFWNGALAADVNRSEAYLPDDVSFPVTFGEGAARLLVKMDDAETGIDAQILAPDGSGAAAVKSLSGRAIAPLGMAPALAAAAPEAPAQGGAWDLAGEAVLAATRGLSTDALPLLAKACEKEPRAAALRYLHARTLESAEHLPETQRKNDARRLVEQAVELDPKYLPALVRKARFLEDDGKPEQALKALVALEADFPEAPRLLRAVYEVARKQGWDVETETALEKIAALLPHDARTATEEVDIAQARGAWKAAHAALERACADDRSDRSLVERLARMDIRMGAAEKALSRVSQLVARNPGEAGPLHARADVLEALSKYKEAAADLVGASEIGGGEPQDLVRAGDLLLEAGDQPGARALYQTALATVPGDFGLRREIARLGGDSVDFVERLAIDGNPLMAAAPGNEKYAKASSICVLDHTISRIYKDGSQTDHVHQIYKILDQHAVEKYHKLALPGEIMELRTIAADGTVYEPIMTDDTREILLPKLEPGAFVEYRYRSVRAAAPEFQYDSGAFYFKDPGLEEPVCLSRYDVIIEKGFDCERIQKNFPVEPTIEAMGNATHYRWELKDSDLTDEEPMMPEKDELLPWVELVQRRSWDDIHEVMREHTLGMTRLTPELRARAAELTDGLKTDAEKAKKIYDFVSDLVRNPRGPSEASEILEGRAGNRVTLLKALLDASDVPSRYAFTGANPQLSPPQSWDPPRPELVSSAEALVIEPRGADPIWIFVGGSRLEPMGIIPLQVQGAAALLIGKQGGELRVVPQGSLEDLRSDASTTIELDGVKARIHMDAAILDASAYGFKEQVAVAKKAELQNFVEQQLSQLFLGARVKGFGFPDAAVAGKPFRMYVDAEVPRIVEERDGGASLKTGMEPLNMVEQFGGKPERVHPLLFRMAHTQHDATEIVLGAGWEAASVPQDLLLRERFASYSLSFSVDAGKVRVTRSVSMLPARIEPRDYPRFLKFLREVDNAEAKRIELRAVAR